MTMTDTMAVVKSGKEKKQQHRYLMESNLGPGGTATAIQSKDQGLSRGRRGKVKPEEMEKAE